MMMMMMMGVTLAALMVPHGVAATAIRPHILLMVADDLG